MNPPASTKEHEMRKHLFILPLIIVKWAIEVKITITRKTIVRKQR